MRSRILAEARRTGVKLAKTTPGVHSGQRTLRGAAQEVEGLYTRDFGDAAGDVVEAPASVFKREFGKVTVTVDCNHMTSDYAWK